MVMLGGHGGEAPPGGLGPSGSATRWAARIWRTASERGVKGQVYHEAQVVLQYDKERYLCQAFLTRVTLLPHPAGQAKQGWGQAFDSCES
jgi:hypothetical protein